MKHCVNCIHYVSPGTCGRTVKVAADPCSDFAKWLVMGGPEPVPPRRHFLCVTERTGTHEMDCGEGARFFEPKAPVVEVAV